MPNRKTVIIRSGGLGDFILTLPFISHLADESEELTVVTRRSYAVLVQDDFPHIQFIDIDGPKFASMLCGRCDVLPLLEHARVYSFLPDNDASLSSSLLTAGAAAYIQLRSRPAQPPHVALQMFQDAGIDPPDTLLTYSMLESITCSGRKGALWIHPGSGSRQKNAPLRFFVEQARRHRARRLIVSYGEADLDLVEPAREAFRDFEAEHLVLPSLTKLRARLEQDAVGFIGNDTGVTHLAATLGIPAVAVFRSTDPTIWHPVGKQVSLIDHRLLS